MSGHRDLQVLIVDSGQGMTEMLGHHLRAMGHRVVITAWTTALAKARDVPPDVVVLALDLCHNDAAELGRGLHEQSMERKPLVVGLADPEDPEASWRAGEVGAHLVLVNPVEPAILAGVLRRFRDLLIGFEVADATG